MIKYFIYIERTVLIFFLIFVIIDLFLMPCKLKVTNRPKAIENIIPNIV